ncbi:putative gustatory receptor 59b [Drosophila sulfurigaster albostrigata]|uniref:putative gustatory receptor 59b n=1 Tax=Drosophila sulfurigaster albostrigata TaxID=89887 RepID=UPI002D21CD8A|nr:putative gustatory receptor 59b [Drosophila sulfurigaster albostrigata]
MWPEGKVQRLLYELYAYFAIFIGVTSYRYDYKRRVYKNNKWTQLVASLGNLFVYVLIPLDIYYVVMGSFGLDSATDLTVRLDTLVNDVVCLLRVVQRVPRERATKQLFQQLQRVQRIHRFGGVKDTQVELQMERIYLLKNILLWLLTISLLIFMMLAFEKFGSNIKNPIGNRLIVILYILVIDGQDVAIHMHFLLTWRICQLYLHLNARVKQLLKRNAATVTLELQHLRWQHWQLALLFQRLNVAYNFILLSSRFSLIVTAAALGYYISILRSMENKESIMITSFALYAMIALDCYLLDLIYDLTKQCHRETTWQLKEHNLVKNSNSHLSNGCEQFALQIACFPLEIKPYGLFPSGKATWLSNIVCIFSWMIVLLQYHMVAEK